MYIYRNHFQHWKTCVYCIHKYTVFISALVLLSRMNYWITYLKYLNKIFAFIDSHVLFFFSNVCGTTVVCIHYMFPFPISFHVWCKAFWLSSQLWITYLTLLFSFILKVFIQMLFNSSRLTVAWIGMLIINGILFKI